jgi:3-hydroxybutyryl-CoA dehydrogenase
MVKRVAVIGAGTMGHGIAQVAAMAGFATRITDSDERVLARARERIQSNLAGAVGREKLTQMAADAALSRIVAVPDVSDVVCQADLVIEAIVEDLQAKRDLFRLLDQVTSAETVLATNTSSLSVGQIAAATRNPTRVLGMHFFNPVHIMRLVELVVHSHTDNDVLATTRAVAISMGKTPIVVRDTPGFASSRLGLALGLEAMRLLEAGVASAEDLDTAMELGYGHPMGPLRVSDLVGLDVRLNIAEYLHRELDAPHFRPPEILRDKVRRGELGKKAGKGFYEWPKNQSS